MNDSLGALLALVVIWIVIKFAVGGTNSSGRSGTAHAPADGGALGRAARMRQVPQQQVDRLRGMFPHVSETSIRYDLLRTNDVEITCEKILREGGLPEPPSGLFNTATPNTPFTNRTADDAAHSKASPSKSPSLIARYNLERRLRDEAALAAPSSPSPSSASGGESTPLGASAKGKGKEGASAWGEGKNARESALRERKERMILQARRRLEEKEALEREGRVNDTTQDASAGVGA